MKKLNIQKEIEKLLVFGQHKHMIDELDIPAARNELMNVFSVSLPYLENIDEQEVPDSPVPILNNMLDYAVNQGILEADTATFRDLLDAKIMGVLMPRPSECAKNFWDIAKSESIEKATEYFYQLSKDANYIRMDRIKYNQYWSVETSYGDIEITINLSKPEKDPKEIAAIRDMPSQGYPKCMLCPENVGYAGRIDHPARQNHRIIPLELHQKRWFFQYSPYLYYQEHSIVLSEQHEPMKIDEGTFVRLFDFLKQFPHYFIGSNADLPIVGGSILNHDHFQAGNHTFAMETAPNEQEYRHHRYPDVTIGRVKWPMSVVRLSSRNSNSMISLAKNFLDQWRTYSDLEVDIRAFSQAKNTEKVPHNTITPIARMKDDGVFELDLVLRNNRTSEQYPDGIFHPHAHLHHIKKENIGLIEVMGLAVLPGRLKQEISDISQILSSTDAEKSIQEVVNNDNHPLHTHGHWMNDCYKQWRQDEYNEHIQTKMIFEERLQREVGYKYLQVLEDAGVFKRDSQGEQAFNEWMRSVGCELR